MEFKLMFSEDIELINQAIYIILNCSGPSYEQWRPYEKKIICPLLM